MKNLRKFKFFLINWFESQGFYISSGWMKKKKKKKKEIVYIWDSWYIIPELPPEAFNKEKKPKYLFFNNKVKELYLKFDLNVDFFTKDYNYIYWFKNAYNIGLFWNFTWFAFTLKFDFLRLLQLIVTFHKNYFINCSGKRMSLSKYNYKLLNSTLFNEFFTKFINPNKPLVWVKGRWYIGKKKGHALILIWRIIHWQLFYEFLNKPFQFTNEELQLFKIAGIDPYDSKYYWAVRRLNLLGYSTDSGLIRNWTTTNYSNWKQVLNLTNFLEKFVRFKILKQILWWKEILYQLFINDKLIFGSRTYNGIKKSSESFESIPLGYIGWKYLFFYFNYLYDDETEVNDSIESLLSAAWWQDIYTVLSFCFRNWNFKTLLKIKSSKNKFLIKNNLLQVYSNNCLIDNEYILKYLYNKENFFDSFKISDLNKITFDFFFRIRGSTNHNELFSLPNFLSELFVLLSDEIVDKDKLEDKIIKPILNNYETYQSLLKSGFKYFDFFDWWLNLFFTTNFKNLVLSKIGFNFFKTSPIQIYSLIWKNFKNFFTWDFISELNTWTKTFWFFTTILFLNKNSFNTKSIILWNAITPSGIIFLKLSNLSRSLLKLKNYYKYFIIFNIYIYLQKNISFKKKNMYIKIFIYKYLYISKVTKSFFKKLNKFVKISFKRYTRRFLISISKPKEFRNLKSIADYFKWSLSFVDSLVENKKFTKNLKNLNNCLPNYLKIFESTINLYNEAWIEKPARKKIFAKTLKKNVVTITRIHHWKLQRKATQTFILDFLTWRLWITSYYSNINNLKASLQTYLILNMFNNLFINYLSTNIIKYSWFPILKIWHFTFIKLFFVLNKYLQNSFIKITIKTKKKWKLI